MFDTNNREPFYYQLAKKIEDKIDNGIWKKGEKITSERELCIEYNVSRITVRNAINELEKKGKLEKIQGKGTFVLGKNIVQNLGNVYSFSKEMEKQGKITSTKLLIQKIIKADFKIANQLNIEEGCEVVYLERLRIADDLPIMLEKTYFEYAKYPFMLTLDLKMKSLYKTLENDFGITINKAVERFKACSLTNEECIALNCHRGQYGLLVKRTSYFKDKIVCYSTIVSKGDIYEFTVKLES
jgi:GntR family transcriptional regulator